MGSHKNIYNAALYASLILLFPSIAVAGLADPIPAPIVKGSITIELQSIVSGVQSPLDLRHAGDGSDRLFFLEQPGTVRIIESGVLLPTPFLDVSARMPALGLFGLDFDERGLLGQAFHPDFGSNRKFYTFTSELIDGPADFTVTLPIGETFDHQSVIAEWTVDAVDPNLIDLTSRREILRIDNPQFNHNGGDINFGNDGNLYIGLGDGGAGNDIGSGHSFPQGNGQDPTNVLGTFLRIDVDGNNSNNAEYGIPGDNPFFGGTLDPGDVIPDEIFATGFRNPYRFSVDPVTGDIIIGDVGQGNIEEVDILSSGGNFGWNLKEGTFRFDPNTGMVDLDPGGPLTDPLIDPVLEYDHDEGISVIGGFVYRGSAIPELAGKYIFGEFTNGGFVVPAGRLFFGDLVTGVIEELIIGAGDRDLDLFVKGFGVDADGELYVLGDLGLGANSTMGEILKIVPIPLPASVWLFGSALTALVIRRRTQRRS